MIRLLTTVVAESVIDGIGKFTRSLLLRIVFFQVY